MNRAIIVMGPAGNGKSTLGQALAAHLGYAFVEGDDCHPPTNIAKMARGEPLNDADRWPFLNNVALALTRHPQGAVASCSALKRSYRDYLREKAGAVTFVVPQVPATELHRRLTARSDHFMPASLLDTQLADFEPPEVGEDSVAVDGTAPTIQQITQIDAALRGTT